MRKIKDAFMELVQAAKNDEDDLALIERNMNAIVSYVNRVFMMEYSMPIYKIKYEGRDLQEKIMDLDKARRIAHEAAISAVSKMNRLAVIYKTSIFYDGDIEDRYAVGDFCENVVSEFFAGRDKAQPESLTNYIAKALDD